MRGAEIGPAEWDALWVFYQDTGSRKWGHPYLTREFFDLVGKSMGDKLLLFLAYRGSRPIAGALNFIGPDTLYGRYWGCTEEVPFLHFELCYYQAIEWAIDHGLACVQAGAQGEHKLARGYEPVITRSAHFIPNPGFRAAVATSWKASARQSRRKSIGCARSALPFVLVRIDCDETPARIGHPAVHRRRRETPRRFARGATAISPPLPPSDAMSASTPSSACCSASPPIRTRAASSCAATARMKYSPDPVADTAAARSSA